MQSSSYKHSGWEWCQAYQHTPHTYPTYVLSLSRNSPPTVLLLGFNAFFCPSTESTQSMLDLWMERLLDRCTGLGGWRRRRPFRISKRTILNVSRLHNSQVFSLPPIHPHYQCLQIYGQRQKAIVKDKQRDRNNMLVLSDLGHPGVRDLAIYARIWE